MGYVDWELKSAITGVRTNSQGGFGTFELQYQADDSGESLHEPSSTAPSDMTEITTSWRPKTAFSMKALKRTDES